MKSPVVKLYRVKSAESKIRQYRSEITDLLDESRLDASEGFRHLLRDSDSHDKMYITFGDAVVGHIRLHDEIIFGCKIYEALAEDSSRTGELRYYTEGVNSKLKSFIQKRVDKVPLLDDSKRPKCFGDYSCSEFCFYCPWGKRCEDNL